MTRYTITLQEPTGIELTYPVAHHDPTKINNLAYHTIHMRNRLDIEAVRWYKIPFKFEDTNYQPTTDKNFQMDLYSTRQLRFLDFKHLMDQVGEAPVNTLMIWPTGKETMKDLPEFPGPITIQLTTLFDQDIPASPLYVAGPVDRGLRAINRKNWVQYTHWPLDRQGKVVRNGMEVILIGLSLI